MRTYIHRFNQQQIARFMTFALIPAVIAGIVGLVYAAFTIVLLIVVAPLFGVGIYIYWGYIRIGWKGASGADADRVWNWSMYYNGIICFFSCLLLIGALPKGFNDEIIMMSITAAGQAAVCAASVYAKQAFCNTQPFDQAIAQIGLS